MLRRLLTDERGISLTEVLIAGAMASIIATAFLLVFSAFSKNVSLEEARAAALSDVQGAMTELSAELRQAVPLTAGSPIVEVLDSQRDLLQARRDYQQARYQYILNGLSLKQAAGSLSPQDIAQVNRWLQ